MEEPTGEPQRSPKKQKSRRGGRRPGAGAPKGNFNALKTGLYSKQLAALGSRLASDPKLQAVLLDIGRRAQLKQQKASEIAAVVLTRYMDRVREIAGGSTEGLNLNLPVDDWDSIRKTAAKLTGGKHGSDGRHPSRKKFAEGTITHATQPAEKNQTPHTKRTPKAID